MGPKSLEKSFANFAALISKWAGSSTIFALASISILAWAVCGPFFSYSAEWQMIVNTGTTICTFLMVFIIQNSQNRDGVALQIKLDEIIRAVGSAKNSMIDLESLSQLELETLRGKFAMLAQNARKPPSRKPAPVLRKRRSTA
jgi:low affinity Fe/Cu permease